MKLPGVVLASIETTLNRLVEDQPGLIDERLAGKTLLLHFSGIELQLYFRFQRNRVIVLNEIEGTPDAGIRGTPLALMTAGLGKTTDASDLILSGDLQLAQAFESMLGRIDIDWEEILSAYTGDILAHEIGNTIRGLGHWGQQAMQAFSEDLREYLHYESRHLPLPDEVDAFNRSVDEVRASVERFELRLQRLQDRLATQGRNP